MRPDHKTISFNSRFSCNTYISMVFHEVNKTFQKIAEKTELIFRTNEHVILKKIDDKHVSILQKQR